MQDTKNQSQEQTILGQLALLASANCPASLHGGLLTLDSGTTIEISQLLTSIRALSSQRQMLAETLGNCIQASGIVRDGCSFSGPELLMFGEDLHGMLSRLQQAASEASSTLGEAADGAKKFMVPAFFIVKADTAAMASNLVAAIESNPTEPKAPTTVLYLDERLPAIQVDASGKTDFYSVLGEQRLRDVIAAQPTYAPSSNSDAGQQTTIEQFLAVLAAADSVTVDDSPLLGSWDASDITGDPENEILHFSWVDEDGLKFSTSATEAGLATGRWTRDSFVFLDFEGNTTEIKLHKHQPLSLLAHQA